MRGATATVIAVSRSAPAPITSAIRSTQLTLDIVGPNLPTPILRPAAARLPWRDAQSDADSPVPGRGPGPPGRDPFGMGRARPAGGGQRLFDARHARSLRRPVGARAGAAVR